jgi:hypothetical protein
VSELEDLGHEAPAAGLQHPPVGVSKAGEVDVYEFGERAVGLDEAGLELARRGPQGRDRRVARRRRRAPGIAEQRLAGDGVVRRGAPGGQEGLGLAGAQAVAVERGRQRRLLAPRQRRQGVGRGGGQSAGIDAAGHLGHQPAAEDQAPVHPAPTAAEQRGDARRRQVIVVGQRAHHAGLVHRAQGAARGIGLQQPGLAQHAGSVLHDHRHLRVAVARPVRQALEAVQDFIGPVGGGGDPQRQRGQPAGGIGARPAQRGQGGGQLRDRQIDDEAHRRRPSTGRTCERGDR